MSTAENHWEAPLQRHLTVRRFDGFKRRFEEFRERLAFMVLGYTWALLSAVLGLYHFYVVWYLHPYRIVYPVNKTF